MDPLSDLLRVVRLDGAYFYAVQAAGPWTVETVAARELSPRIMPAAEHLISYHIVTDGRCYGGVIGEKLVELVPGDVIVFPHGDAHVMSSGRDVRIGEDVQRTPPPHPHAGHVERVAQRLHPPGDRRIPTRPRRRGECPHPTGRGDVHRGAASLPRPPAAGTDRLARRPAR